MLYVVIVVLIALALWGIYQLATDYKEGDGNIEQYIDGAAKRYNPNNSKWAKNHAIKAAAKNSELASSLSIEMQSLIAMTRTKTLAIITQFDQDMARLRQEIRFSAEVVDHKKLLLKTERDMALIANEIGVINAANRAELPAAVYSELKLEERKMELRLLEEEKRAKLELTAADFADLSPYQQVEILTNKLKGLREKRNQLAWGNEPRDVKYPLMERYDKNIKALERDIDARNKGLIQAQKK